MLVLTVIFVPLVIRTIPYFKRPDVHARRSAKARLPAGILLYELLSVLLFSFVIGFLFFELISFVHDLIHPGLPLLSADNASLSLDSVLKFLKVTAAFIVGLPLGMIVSNIVAWCIPAIRRTETKVYEGVPGGSFREANAGLFKFASITIPIALIIAVVSVMRP